MSEKKKIRNYSFKNSRRLPIDKMTEVNGIRIPSMPGSCYHAIICSLAQNKNKFCSWDKIIELTEKYMKQYGGQKMWDKFTRKGGVKGYKQRIKDNTHTLTRTGKDCYGYRLHERGMCIYFFKDGATLFTGGEFSSDGETYVIRFSDGRGLQIRYRGTTMTFQEYKKFLDDKYIDINGQILNHDAIRDFRVGLNFHRSIPEEKTPISSPALSVAQVSVTLDEGYTQDTANRLDGLGFVVEQAIENELIGTIAVEKISSLQGDRDVLDVTSLSGVQNG